jgi:hypothetical protein
VVFALPPSGVPKRVQARLRCGGRAAGERMLAVYPPLFSAAPTGRGRRNRQLARHHPIFCVWDSWVGAGQWISRKAHSMFLGLDLSASGRRDYALCPRGTN